MKFYSEFNKISDTKWEPMSTHNMPFDEVYGLGKTQEELELEGILTEDPVPMHITPTGLMVTGMFINPITKELLYEYAPLPVPPTDPNDEILQRLAVTEKNQVDIQMAMAEMMGM